MSKHHRLHSTARPVQLRARMNRTIAYRHGSQPTIALRRDALVDEDLLCPGRVADLPIRGTLASQVAEHVVVPLDPAAGGPQHLDDDDAVRMAELLCTGVGLGRG